MRTEYNERIRFCDLKNAQLQSTAENMRLSILGKDNKIKDEKPLGVVDAYVKENTTELVDPLVVQKKLESLEEKRNKLLTELDTQLKYPMQQLLLRLHRNGLIYVYITKSSDSASRNRVKLQKCKYQF